MIHYLPLKSTICHYLDVSLLFMFVLSQKVADVQHTSQVEQGCESARGLYPLRHPEQESLADFSERLARAGAMLDAVAMFQPAIFT